MRFISLHCDYIKFKPVKKAIKEPEQLSKEREKGEEIKEVLVVLTAVESMDDIETADDYVENIKDIASQVKVKKILLYPYAHLSSDLAKPNLALSVLEKAEMLLKKDYEVHRAPFGYYKEFELKCKGHPLAELSREIRKGIKGKKDENSSKIGIIEEKYDTSRLLKEISRTKLDTSKLKENDHRIIGQKLDLFSFNESAPGSVFWHENGLAVFNELVNFSRELHKKFGYKEILTPFIFENKLWKVSGHWEHYKENMFFTDYENRNAAVKPMNCPGMMLVYRTKTRSYKDLPLRMFEFGTVHRKELSGVLAGLFRVIKITMDDAHIFCSLEQVEQEIINIFELVKEIYKETFNFDYSTELSTRPEKFMGDKKDWEIAENALENALKKAKVKYKVNKGEGAFYGPKIDIHIKDSLGRSWQCATIQLDMQMPKRFELEYTGKDNKIYIPILIHRAIFGSMERFIGILLEHLNGNLPLWLAPIQVRVLSFTNRNLKYAQNVYDKLRKEGFRADNDFRDITIDAKVRDAEIMKVNYTIVVGDKEEKGKTIAVRRRGNKKVEFGADTDKFINDLKTEINERR